MYVYDTSLALKSPPDLCLHTKHLEYCLLFSESFYFYKNTIAGCLKLRMKFLTLKTVLINKQAGCYKLPADSKLNWKEILFSNKTSSNLEIMNKNIGNWIV